MSRRSRSIDDENVGTGSGDIGTNDAATATEHDNSNGSVTADFVDPATAISTPADGTSVSGEPRRRRGRPPGSGNKNKAPKSAIGADGIAALLVTLHSGLVIVSKCPELEITEDEAAKLAKASKTVADLYDMQASQKAIAWTNFIGIAGSIYITRIIAISIRLREQRKPPSKEGNVITPQWPN